MPSSLKLSVHLVNIYTQICLFCHGMSKSPFSLFHTLADGPFLFFFSRSRSQASGCCSTSMACSSAEGCRSLLRKSRSRSWSTLRDNLWCRLFLSQMQGTASDKLKQTSSLISWECLWVNKLLAKNCFCFYEPLLTSIWSISDYTRPSNHVS